MDTGSAIVLTAIFLASKWNLMAHFMDMEPVTTSVRVTPPPHLILTVHVFYYEAGQPTHPHTCQYLSDFGFRPEIFMGLSLESFI